MENNEYIELLKPYLTEDELAIYIKSLDDSYYNKGAIINTNLVSFETLKEDFPFIEKNYKLESFINFTSENNLSKSPFHYGGAYYLVDPSSVEVVYPLYKNLNEGSIVFDLCAAPGGKSIILALLRPDILIVSNETNQKRAQILKSNIQRLGLTNVVVTNNSIKDFAGISQFSHAIDGIILDVPCSGIGMNRKKTKMEDDYSEGKAEKLAPLQLDLLKTSLTMLKDKGLLVYSTCSYNGIEDEGVVSQVLNEDKTVEHIDLNIENAKYSSSKIGSHLIPPFYKGEGHYVCLLKKHCEESYDLEIEKVKLSKDNKIELPIIEFKKSKYVADYFLKQLNRLNIVSIGVELLNNFQNEKAYYNVNFSHTKYGKNLLSVVSTDDIELANKYLIGYEIPTEFDKNAEVAFAYKGVNLGYGKVANGRLKNYFPKGLRKKD